MVEVSGLAVKTIPLFIKENFGDEGFEKWSNKLDSEVAELFKKPIVVNNWFNIQDIFIRPLEILCDLFYNGDKKSAWQLGRFSADYGLKGVLKAFIKLGSVNYFIKRSVAVIPNYYRPIVMTVPANETRYALLRITDFPDISELVEYRIGGWMERALEISTSSEELQVKITKSLARKDEYTEFEVRWS